MGIETGKISRHPSVLSTDLDQSFVMMSLTEGNYYDVDDSAAAIWKLIEKPMTLDQICAELAMQYKTSAEECAADVTQFIEAMHKQSLVVIEA